MNEQIEKINYVIDHLTNNLKKNITYNIEEDGLFRLYVDGVKSVITIYECCFNDEDEKIIDELIINLTDQLKRIYNK